MDNPASTSALTSLADPSLAAMIVKTPGTCGGKPRIAGTRIKVKHVFVWVEQMGMTPAQVVQEYPHLNMAQVHAALSYYWSHPEEIRQELAEEEKLVAELKAKSPPSKLQDKLTRPDATDDSLPPR